MDGLREIGVGVKLYVDRERWDWMGQLIPGYPCVLTNLLYVKVLRFFIHKFKVAYRVTLVIILDAVC